MKHLLFLTCLLMTAPMFSQNETLPFREIPDSPETYSAGNVVGRLIDGLGFRYYWATEGLTPVDLDFRPTEEARSVAETIDHLYLLSLTIVNAPQSKVNERPLDTSHLNFEQKRKATLLNLEKASQLYKADGTNEMEAYQVIFNRGGNKSEFPFWNMINGPITDAIHHTGQVVTLRRTAGNPINPNISVFTGTVRE